MAVRKDKTKPWLNLCVHQGPNPAESQHKVGKTTGKLAIQAACSSWDTLCEHRDTCVPTCSRRNPFSWHRDQAQPPCCFLPFPTTLSIRTLVIDKKHVVRMAPSTSLLPRRLKYQKDPNSDQLLWLFGSKI